MITPRALLRPCRRRALRGALVLAGVGMVAGAGAPPAALARPAYVPGRVVVGYARPSSGATAEVDRRLGVRAAATPAALPSAAVRTMRVPRGETVTSAISRLRHRPGVAYAVPDYIAHAAAAWIPDDRGRGQIARGWEAVQWNFLPTTGIDAPDAWANLIADGHPGARGVTVAVLDSGVAYRNWRSFHRSPDFAGTRFVDPYDFVAGNAYPLDREDHGTFVTGTIAEATNNGIGLTGLAYGASIMPVRVLDRYGDGDAVTIAKGIRYAVEHHAQVINLSLEFDLGIGGGQLPELASALRYAHDHGVVVVAAAGNDSGSSIAYPASAPTVISVGATTRDRCLADYSNTSSHLDLVAPGGGDDANLIGDPNCHPNVSLPGVYQMMFPASDPSRFGLYSLYGTSMAAPDVSSAAAMVIASGVIGRHPSPAQVLARLEQTALQLGKTKPNPDYGYGLLDLAAATAPSPASTP